MYLLVPNASNIYKKKCHDVELPHKYIYDNSVFIKVTWVYTVLN